jgi:hypothetical protein
MDALIDQIPMRFGATGAIFLINVDDELGHGVET